MLLNHLHVSFGISGSSLLWFRSYLSGGRQSVRCGGVSSSLVDLVCGLPQGSSLGSILFLLYTADLPSIVTAHGLPVHLYGSCRPDCTSALSSSLSSCSNSVSEWMRSNRLQLNADKADVMWCASACRLSSLPSAPVSIAGSDVLPVATVRSLGVLVNSDLGAASHVQRVVSRCFAALRQLRRYVSDACFRSLVVALVHSHLDYGNFILVRSPAYRLRYLQTVLNAAARLTYRLGRYDHITDALISRQ
jgi:Reverse transcriptase (RNA-dependent DNA polymerase)